MADALRGASLSGTRLVAAAIALSPAERTRIVEGFFVAHPGEGDGRYGLGRAVLDFQAWEVASGRIDGTHGSAWWRGVNGLIVLDIAAALRGVRGRHPAVRLWQAFAAGHSDTQQSLWRAHQCSLHLGVRICAPLLEQEPEPERSFAGIVIDIVDRTALTNSRTDSGELARLTDRFYPKEYPVTEEALPAIQRMQERTAGSLLDGNGEAIVNVGLKSTRWR